MYNERQNFTARVGGSVSLPCYASTSGDDTILEWSKDDEVIYVARSSDVHGHETIGYTGTNIELIWM